jgi:hypothetical protein
MCLKVFKTPFTLLKASLFPGFNPITPVFKSRVAYPKARQSGKTKVSMSRCLLSKHLATAKAFISVQVILPSIMLSILLKMLDLKVHLSS